MSAQLLLDSSHPLLHFVLARCRWLLHYHPMTSPPAFPPTPDEAREGSPVHPWYQGDLSGWYRVPACPPWRTADLYQYFDADRQLGITSRDPPDGIEAWEIKTLDRPPSPIDNSEVWTQTWQQAYILAEEVALPAGGDGSVLRQITSFIEGAWTEPPADFLLNTNTRLGMALLPRHHAVDLAGQGTVDTTLFFSGAVDLVTEYLALHSSGLQSAEVLTSLIQGYIALVESELGQRVKLLTDAVDHLANVVSELVDRRVAATVDEYEFASYLASLYVRTVQMLVRRRMLPGWSATELERLELLASNLDEIFAYHLGPSFTFAARWRPKRAAEVVARCLEIPDSNPRPELRAAPPSFVDTVREMMVGRGGTISGIGSFMTLGGPPGFDPIEFSIWAKYCERAGTGLASLTRALEDQFHPISPRLRDAGESFLWSSRVRW